MPSEDKETTGHPAKPASGAPAVKDKDWQEQEDFLEESLEETFPGSDPIAPGHPRKHE
jgi:hypothetical protein